MSNPEITVENVEEGLAEQSPSGVVIEVPHGGSQETPMTVDESGITNQNSATDSAGSGGSSPGRKIIRYVANVVHDRICMLCAYLTLTYRALTSFILIKSALLFMYHTYPVRMLRMCFALQKLQGL